MKQLEENIKAAHSELLCFQSLVLKWQSAVNLISKKSEDEIWVRHVLDSAQLFFLLKPSYRVLVDMGSGGGFPGVVIAILNKCLGGSLNSIVLIESDIKKSLFLKEATRQLDLDIIVLNQRLESVHLSPVDVVTARALAPINRLLDWAKGFSDAHTEYLFLKGENVEDEEKDVLSFCSIKKISSVTNSKGCIVQIKEK